jgi:hypothetical protein
VSALASVTDAVYDLLESASLNATVYRYIPQNPSYPYVTLRSGVETRQGRFSEATGKSLLLQAHVFTSSQTYAGAQQALDLVAAISEAMEYAALTVTGWTVVFCRPEQSLDAGEETVDGVVYQHYIVFIRVEVLPA